MIEFAFEGIWAEQVNSVYPVMPIAKVSDAQVVIVNSELVENTRFAGCLVAICDLTRSSGRGLRIKIDALDASLRPVQTTELELGA
jgi:hypothetical protein